MCLISPSKIYHANIRKLDMNAFVIVSNIKCIDFQTTVTTYLAMLFPTTQTKTHSYIDLSFGNLYE